MTLEYLHQENALLKLHDVCDHTIKTSMLGIQLFLCRYRNVATSDEFSGY